MAEIAEKVFENFLEVPDRVRMRIINKMELDDRCRLTRCSKLCGEEVNNSKNYVYELRLEFFAFWKKIHVTFDEYEDRQNRRHGFTLQFSNRLGETVEECTNFSNQTLWISKSARPTKNLVEHAIKKFKKLLETHQKTIKKLYLTEGLSDYQHQMLKNVKFEIKGLDNLENLAAHGHINLQQIFAKMKKPLKRLHIEEKKNSENLARHTQIYQVENFLIWWKANLNNQQFLQFRTKDLLIPIGKLTEKDIFKFIRSWQNGTIGKNIEVYKWRMNNSEFNIQKLLRFLRVGSVDIVREGIEIKHYIKAGKSATLFLMNGYLIFNASLKEDFI